MASPDTGNLPAVLLEELEKFFAGHGSSAINARISLLTLRAVNEIGMTQIKAWAQVIGDLTRR
jgi:hypothetical protein